MRTEAAHKVSTRGDVSPVAWHMSQGDAKHMGRDVPNSEKNSHFQKVCKNTTEIPPS